MHSETLSSELDSHTLRQHERASGRLVGGAFESAKPSAGSPVLLNDEQAAGALGVSRRKFHELRGAAWMPRPIALSPRIVRWSRLELETAVANMPRQEQPSEPAALRRSRIEALKRGGAK